MHVHYALRMPDWSRQSSKKRIISGVMRRRTVLAECTRCERFTNGASRSSFMAARAASWQMEETSAPEHPSVWLSGQATLFSYQLCKLIQIHSWLNSH